MCVATGTTSPSEPSLILQYRLKSGVIFALPGLGSNELPWLSADKKYLCERGHFAIYRLSDVARTKKAQPMFRVWLERKFDGMTMSKEDQDVYFRRLFDGHWIEREHDKPGKTYEHALDRAKTNPYIREEVEKATASAHEMIRAQMSPSLSVISFEPAGWLDAKILAALTFGIEDYGPLVLSVNVETKIVSFYVRSLTKDPALLKRDDAWLRDHFSLAQESAAQGLTLKFEPGEIPPEVQKLANDLQRRRESKSQEQTAAWKKYEEEMKRKTPPKER